MSVELEWHFGDEVPKQAPQEERRPRRPRWRFWLTLAAILLALVGVGLYAWWRVRREALKMVESDVQAVAQLELQALAQRDVALYLSLQDQADPHWQQAQRARVALGVAFPPPLPGLAATAAVSVENARAVGDGARVEVVRFASLPDGQALPFRATRFYRRDDDGRWLHTRADLGYAGHTVIFTGQRVVVTSFATDADLMEPVAFKLEGIAEQFCDLIACRSSASVPLVFTDTLDAAQEPGGALPAPFVAGVPAGELAHAAWEQALEDLLLDRLAAREAGYLVNGTPRGAQGGELFRARGRAWLRAKLGLQQAPAPPDLDLVGRALDAHEWLPLDAIWRFPLAQDDPRRPLAEAQVDLLLAFVEQEYGPSGVVDLLAASYQIPWVGTALQGALGEAWSAFDPRYAAYVRQAAGRPAEAEPPGEIAAFAGFDLVVACDGLTNLWGVRLDRPAMTPLSSGPGFDILLWSPDGARLVARRKAIYGGGLVLLPAAGSAARWLAGAPADAVPLAWSPDGRYVAYSVASASPQGWVVDVELAESVALGSLVSLAWSPDGSQLAYAAFQDPSEPPSLWLADADGSNARQVASGSPVAWSPDGAQIAFVSARNRPTMEIYDVNTEVTRTLLDGPVPIHPLSVYINANTEVTRTVLDGSALVSQLYVGTERTFPNLETLAWSPAGDWIGFGVNQHVETGPVNGYVGLVRPDGSGPHVLLTHEGGVYVSEWSPAGRWVLSLAYTGDQITTTVTAVDGQALFESSSWAGGSLSPDGRYVALIEGNGMHTLRVAGIEAGDSYSFELPGACVSLAWNPHGLLREPAQDYWFETPCG